MVSADVVEGTCLTSEQARELEQRLEEEPTDLAARSKLLGFYMSAALVSTEMRRHRARHALWCVEHAPRADVTGSGVCCVQDERAAELWKHHVAAHPDDARILAHAARNVRYSEAALADLWIARARQLAPEANWRLEFELEVEPPRCKVDEPPLAQDESAWPRFRELRELIVRASLGGDIEAAARHATEILTLGDGDAIYIGHETLGRAALARGDVLQAVHHLFEAATTPGSPVLGSFGPRMNLAQALVAHGERDAVREFLVRCHRFWKGHTVLDVWIGDLDAGRTPDFRMHLDGPCDLLAFERFR